MSRCRILPAALALACGAPLQVQAQTLEEVIVQARKVAQRRDTGHGARCGDVTYDADVFRFIPGAGELDSPFQATYSDPCYTRRAPALRRIPDGRIWGTLAVTGSQ